VEGLANPRSNVTESRLAILIQATSKLARDADHNSARRLEFLEEERELIDNEIKALKEGLKPVISNLEALERVREIISLGTGLTEDFSRVQEYYKGIHQDLREKILKSDEPLAVVLDEVFENLKHLENTEAGRTFQAFFTLLSNPSQQHTFSFAMKAIRESDFYKDLTEQEKYFLNQFIFLLYDQSCAVHKVTERFSESLHSLLKSREFQERRKITTLLKETFKLAGDLSSKISMTKPLDFFLELSSSNLFSASQMELMDYYPENKLLPVKMAETDTNNISNVLMAMKIDEIDFRSLKSNILKILERFKEASIGDILFSYPAEEGLGSVVGLLHLAQRHGKRKDSLTENISWIGLDGVYRTAYMDKWYFTRECINELSTG
jgi:hypothetical protein